MTLVNFCYLVAGLSLGLAGGLWALASEQGAHVRQVRALVAAYEERIAALRERGRG